MAVSLLGSGEAAVCGRGFGNTNEAAKMRLNRTMIRISTPDRLKVPPCFVALFDIYIIVH